MDRNVGALNIACATWEMQRTKKRERTHYVRKQTATQNKKPNESDVGGRHMGEPKRLG